jgi:hypothetical protein
MRSVLTMYTIYFNPLDYPGRYVVRGFFIESGKVEPGELCVVADTLEQARAAVPPGCAQIARDPDDEPQIVETWI